MLGALVFLSPSGALIAFAVAVPVGAAVAVAARHARTRAVLGLAPGGLRIVEVASLAAVPLLLALAAAGPAIRTHVGRGILASSQAIFVFDVSRSMAAAPGLHAPSRLAQAKAAALDLRDSIPDASAGIASVTTQLLPELFPSADETAFTATVDDAIGVLKPPPPAFQIIATTFDPLAALRDQGFFSPSTRHRVAVLLTDGESTTYVPGNVGRRLVGTPPGTGAFVNVGGDPNLRGGSARPQFQAPVKLLIVRFGAANDRIYRRDGSVDPGYRPDLGAPGIVAELARDTRGRLFGASQLAAAKAALRTAVGSGVKSKRISAMKTTQLAPYAAFAALVPLGLLIWRRNIVAL